jgi:hypothetical protein
MRIMQGTRLTSLAMRVLVLVCLLVSAKSMVVAGATPAAPFPNDGRVPGHFVIGDFDGDQKPDLATVHVNQSHSELTEYSIHLQLSRGLNLSVGLTAPSGGLQLFSRDVNGDDLLDVVVRTALDSNLVAVLINNGHGKFTLAKPEMFPELKNEPASRFNSETNFLAEQIVLLPCRGFAGDPSGARITQRIKNVTEELRREKAPDFRSLLFHPELGRSPPQV